MGNYDGIEKAQYNPGGAYVLPGTYRVEINSVREKETRKKEDAFIVELKVMESTNPERTVGMTMTWIVMLKHDSALGNIKHFCAAAWNIAEKDVTGEYPKAAISEAQPLAKLKLRLVATNVPTRAGGDFTKCQFFPDAAIEAASAASADAARADAAKAAAQPVT